MHTRVSSGFDLDPGKKKIIIKNYIIYIKYNSIYTTNFNINFNVLFNFFTFFHFGQGWVRQGQGLTRYVVCIRGRRLIPLCFLHLFLLKVCHVVDVSARVDLKRFGSKISPVANTCLNTSSP